MAQDTVADTRMAKFVLRGFVNGSLADRSMELLTSKGAVRLTLADKQIELGQKPDPLGHVNPDLYP